MLDAGGIGSCPQVDIVKSHPPSEGIYLRVTSRGEADEHCPDKERNENPRQ